ncbi:ABC-2 type transport system ATP-binding protein [Clostridium pascui]|uniref:ATP-binding cassette domain-containing protein n=1 Tax=Clostridium pascui TaxID=46609 RepID=UPI001958C57E|nr:ABC transporter ATP-binding protein [Clostridium pascui]MBM7870764.1 ABC-2 type transport system ATP-binding protein [Clostridium pascui]
MNYAVEITNLKKRFWNRNVFEDLNLNIEENKIYCLVGRNGAGKTTLLRCIASQYVKTEGSIKAFREEIFENKNALSKIYLCQENGFSGDMTGREIFSAAKTFLKYWDEEFKERLLGKFNVELGKKYGDLSKGMKACLNIIVALASRAPITIFDEAYAGLDPFNREIFYEELLRDYEENPRTIIFSTHYIEEIESLFEGIIFMDKGKIILNEDRDTIDERAFYITGKEEELNDILIKLNVVSKEKIASFIRAGIYDDISYEEKIQLQSKGLTLEKMPLQKLFVNLLKEGVRSE